MTEFGYSMPRYFQNMDTLGKPIAVVNEENKENLRKIEQELQEKIDAAIAAGRSDESLNKSGQMTPMQRLNALIDPGSWCPLNSLYNPYDNEDNSTAVITGLGKISDKWCVLIVSDHKKMAGVWVGGQAYKLSRATDLSKRLRIPLVYILNCSGVKLDEQERVCYGRISGGTAFYRHAELAQMGIPVLVGIFGTNPAGGGYHSISPTILVAHSKSNFAVGGVGIASGMKPKGYFDKEVAQELIDITKAAGESDPPGPMSTHYGITGFVREVYDSEIEVLESLKKYVSCTPCYNENYHRVAPPQEAKFPMEDLYSIVPLNQRRTYDMREVIARLVDGSEFQEFKKDYGPEMICGLAKLNGLLVAVIANYQGFLQNYPEYRENSAGIGGKIYRQGFIKMNEFVTLCGRDKIPIIWIQDTIGIDVGEPAERAELLGLGQGLIYSIQDTDLPQMEITLRKGSTAGAYVLGGPMGNATNAFSIGTPATEMYVMHGETAATAMYARRLVKEQDAGKDIQPTIDKMNELVETIYKNSRPEYCAKLGLLDEIVNLDQVRKYMCAFAGAVYQNPKIGCPFHQMILPRLLREQAEGRC